MSALAGTAELVRLNVRRDRIVIGVCVVAFVAIALFTTSSLGELYPTAGRGARRRTRAAADRRRAPGRAVAGHAGLPVLLAD